MGISSEDQTSAELLVLYLVSSDEHFEDDEASVP